MTDVDSRDETVFVPRSLGPYRIEGELGSGAMGVVFRAVHTGLERAVALKVLRPDTLQDPDSVRRFLREGKSIARLEHPHIVAVYDAGEIDAVYYIAMKFLEGETLQAVLQREGALPTERVVRLGSQLAAALQYAHGRGVIHRDVKPANVIVGEGDQATLTDFGVAQALHTGTARSATFAGTPLYMAPEQIQGREADARADIYSLGCMLYEMCTGRPPFTGQMVAVMFAHINSPVPDIRALVPGIPENIAAAIERALAKNPEDRWQSAGEVLQALARSGGEGIYNPGATVDIEAPMDSTTVLDAETLPKIPAMPAPAKRRFNPLLGLLAIPLLAIIAVVGYFALAPAATGSIDVSTNPAGAAVTLDGSARGKTPLALSAVSTGSHAVTLRLATYRQQQIVVNVDRGKRTRVQSALVSLPASDLVTVPQAVLSTSYTKNSTTHQIIPGPAVSSLHASLAAKTTFYVLAQYQVKESTAGVRDLTFTPSYALYSPSGLKFGTSPSPPTLTLGRHHIAEVWIGGFRMHLKGRTVPPTGTYTVRLLADGRPITSLTFSLTA